MCFVPIIEGGEWFLAASLYRTLVHTRVKACEPRILTFGGWAFVGTGWSWRVGGVYLFSMEDFAESGFMYGIIS